MNPKFEELKVSGELPSPCGVGMSILKLTRDEDYCTNDLVTTLQTDPALTGRLLKLANSSRAAGVAPITTVNEATMRLGANTVRSVALGFSLMSGNRTGLCEAFDYDDYWSRSLLTAIGAQAFAGPETSVSPAEAFVCGLLSRIGALALASTHPKAYSSILVKCAGHPLAEVMHEERRHFEITNLEVSHAMLLDWGLPEVLAEATSGSPLHARDASGIDNMTSVLWAATVISDFYRVPADVRPTLLRELDVVRDAFGLDVEAFFEMCDGLVEDWASQGEVHDILTPRDGTFAYLYARAEELATARNLSPTGVDGIDLPNEPTMWDGGDNAVDEHPVDDGHDTEPNTGAQARILAVEDNNICLRLLVRELEKTGHQVKTASDGKSGLRLALEWNPHIVITDWVMPEMDGLELCEALRRFESGREMYLLILTGNGTEDNTVEAFNAGADDYVIKPFRPRILAARVRAGMRVIKLQERVAADRRKMQEQVAELGVLTRRLEQASLTDSLTGLPNRRFAMQHLAHEWKKAEENGRGLAVIMADIDHFKKVNDEHGHDAGDHVLQEVSRTIVTRLRGNETVCRMGGEEFLVVIGGADLECAMGCAERIRKVLESTVMNWNDFNRPVTVSMGVAEFRPDMSTAFDLVKCADLAAYVAKESGRNCTKTVQTAPVPSA